MLSSDEAELRALYASLLDAWNQRSGEAFAANFADDGLAIGYDGSEHRGKARIAADLSEIFADHITPAYVAKVREVRMLGAEAGLLRAAAGLVQPDATDINPATNAWQTLVADRVGAQWRIVLFQNTPARFHGRPHLAEELTAELRDELTRS